MSGDAQPRKRNKDRKKSKKDSVDIPTLNLKRNSVSDEEDTPGVHSGIENVQMHVQSKDHGVGWCAKIVFFSLMAILGGLVILIVIENRGGSDLDTPLSESRFADYLQGWVEENRVEDHHDEPHLDHDDHDEHLDEGEPFPEEKDDTDTSAPDENEELDAEINAKIDDEIQEADSQETEDNENDIQEAEEQINDYPAAQEDDDDDDDQDENLPVEEEIVREKRETVESAPNEELEEDNDENDSQEQEQEQDEEDQFLDDSLPFEEEFDDDDENSFEEIVDNDAGEDELLQKLAEQEKQKQEEQQQSAENDDVPQDTSQIPSDRGSQSYMDELKQYNEQLQDN